ncbi:DUF6888 family protein [Brasilonema sp. UFV-L1]|uniref:DUF6888 family protein n=1 Tax=Brasilonema sp. UFV-L1 TaxID=2234130 RepID=UPI00403F08D5
MNPTVEQLQQLYRICQSLTQMYIPIYLITLDKRTKGSIPILQKHACHCEQSEAE